MSEDICALKARITELEEKLELPCFMTAQQVADYAGICERSFYDLKTKGDAPPAVYWSKRAVRYERDDVLAWVKAHKAGA